MSHKVKWHLDPLGAHGLAHKAMIKSAKRAIYAVLEICDIRNEDLITAFTGVENLVTLASQPISRQILKMSRHKP